MSPAPRKSSLLGIVAPLISLFTFSVGHGLLSTLVTVRLTSEGVSDQWIGLISGTYFAGLIVGTLVNTKLILGVGHIRAYAAFASILASITLMFGLAVVPEFWLVLRFIGGFATAGLFVVIESWLMVSTSAKIRGQILSLYMVLLYGAMAAGQMILKRVDVMMLIPFALSALAASLSVIPLSLLRTQMPTLEDHGRLPFLKLFRMTPAGVMGSFCGGLLLGVIYGLLPLFFSSVGYEVSATADMMALVIIGGMIMQIPLGRYSDRYDRRLVIAALFGITMVLSITFIWTNAIDNRWLTGAFVFLFGGVMFSIYPISLSHACDELPPEQMINGNQGALMSYSVGAMIGPVIAPWFMGIRGPMGMFVYFTAVSACIVVYLLYRRSVRKPVPLSEHVGYIATVPTSPVFAEMDPRGDPEAEETASMQAVNLASQMDLTATEPPLSGADPAADSVQQDSDVARQDESRKD